MPAAGRNRKNISRPCSLAFHGFRWKLQLKQIFRLFALTGPQEPVSFHSISIASPPLLAGSVREPRSDVASRTSGNRTDPSSREPPPIVISHVGPGTALTRCGPIFCTLFVGLRPPPDRPTQGHAQRARGTTAEPDSSFRTRSPGTKKVHRVCHDGASREAGRVRLHHFRAACSGTGSCPGACAARAAWRAGTCRAQDKAGCCIGGGRPASFSAPISPTITSDWRGRSRSAGRERSDRGLCVGVHSLGCKHTPGR